MITFFVCCALYVGGGVAHRQYAGGAPLPPSRFGSSSAQQDWVALLPHRDFWLEVSGLVRDGLRFTLAFTSGTTRLPPRGYDALPGVTAAAEGEPGNSNNPRLSAALLRQSAALEQWRRCKRPAVAGAAEGSKLHAAAQVRNATFCTI